MSTPAPAQPRRGQAPRRPRGHDPPAGDARRRPRDADRRLPAPRRRRHACLPPRVGRGRRAARPLQLPRASARAGSSRSATASPASRTGRSASTAYAPDLPVTTFPAPDPLAALRAFVPAAARRARRRDAAVHGRGGRRARLRRGLRLRAERPAPGGRPGRRAARQLHRDRPRPGLRPPDPRAQRDRLAPHRGAATSRSRYRIAERAIFEALERTARPSAAEIAGAAAGAGDRRRGAGGGCRRPPVNDEPRTSLGRDAFEAAVRAAKDAIAAGEAIQVVLARRQTPGPAGRAGRAAASTGSASIARCGGSTRARTCSSSGRPSFEVVGASPELLLQVEGDRMTTHPIAGTRPRGATPAEDDAPRRGAAARPEGARRARHARRPGPQRPGPRGPARHGRASRSTWRSSATATCSTS